MVTYNRIQDVERCVDSIFRAVPESLLEFLVLDNGSTDGTVEMLEGRSGIHLIRSPQNLGLAPALKELIRQSVGEWLLFLDSDTIVPNGGIDALLRFARGNDAIGAVAPRMRDLSGKIQMTARNFPGPMNALFGRQTILSRMWPNNLITRKFLKVDMQQENKPFRCDWVVFAAALVRRRSVLAVQSVDPAFFVYWVDADFFRRIGNEGWQVWCYPTVEFIHLEHNRAGDVRRPRAIWDFHYGAFRYFYKHCGWKGLNPILWLAGAGLLTRAGIHLMVNEWYRGRNQR